ncbi:cytochrome P450 [Phanerochaete sordida]|uniref:Cytochrome P450 n=1 Tax=Phanerochaete sordida TaxID=48140 RepID=A0A9P3LAC4_9APHY|nr:cytochrome P450 [Phanerochaete sordida]
MVERASLVLGLVCIVLSTIFASRHNAKKHRYPPGPPGLPLLGSLLDIPTEYSWYTFAKWAHEYSTWNYVTQILNAKEIFEERSRIYSDRFCSAVMESSRNPTDTVSAHRPPTVMTQELVGWHRNFGLMTYGDVWRQRRRLFNQHFKPQAIPAHHAKLTQGARTLTQLLLESPKKFLKHFHRVPGVTILDIIYAMDLDPQDDTTIEDLENAATTFADLADAKGYLVDLIPILKYLPSWLPGAGFKRQAAKWKKLVDRLHDEPYHKVKSDIMSGKPRPCIVSALIHDFEDKLDSSGAEEDILSVGATAYTGADTTTFALANFAFAMLLFPEAQQKAQEELDRVVGRDRLPEITDQDSLPYTTALIRELLRWRPIGPASAIHRSTADDWYGDYFIPAGSMVIGNVWAILHDEERYPDPEAFKPERFLTAEGTLDPSVPDPAQVFGFGRRICPGRFFAHAALFLYISHILAAFTIEKAVDEMGNVVEPTPECEARTFWRPKPFEASFKPRLQGLEGLIHTPRN